MITVRVPDMHCEKCVSRIQTAMEEAKIPCTVDLSAQTVSFAPEHLEVAKEELDDLGFTVEA